MKKLHIVLVILIISLIANGVLAFLLYSKNSQINDMDVWRRAYIELEKLSGVGRLGEIHDHADFKIYINGEELNLNTPKNIEVNKFVHLHDGPNNDNVMHIEAKGVTVAQFFHTIGVDLSRSCIETTEKFCNGQGTLKYYVNGVISEEAPFYQPKDKDKILITFGNESPEEIQAQINSIESNACVQSNNC